jgi:iron complex transport system substrate-binding protein
VKGSYFPSLNLDGFFLPLFPLERGFPVEVLKCTSNNSIFSVLATPIFHKGRSWPKAIFRGALKLSKINYKPAFQASSAVHEIFIFPLLFVLLLFPVQVEKSYAESNSVPKRILSMSPGITEILFSIGAGDRVVGVTDFCDYPAEATKLPRVGGMLNPSFETIITLQPDLIIHQKGSQEVNKLAHRLGIQTLDVPMLSLEDIFTGIPIVGKHIGFSDEAEKLVAELKDEINRHQKGLANVERKSVLLLLGVSTDPGRDMYAVGRGTFIGELLSLAGGENILPVSQPLYPKISKEYVIQKSPEIIIEVGPTKILTKEEIEGRKKKWKKFSMLRAVQNNEIHIISANYFLIPGPRLIKIIAHFVDAIHQELADKFVTPSTALEATP